MGHIRLGTLPKTRKWTQVVNLIASGAEVERIAAASAEAAEHTLESASKDEGLAHAFWLLAQVPQAARDANFADRLWELGLTLPNTRPTLLEVVGAFSNALDAHARESGKRSDLGEMAQLSAVETLTSLVVRQLPGLFGATAADVQQAFAKLSTSNGFTLVAREFFSRLTNRALGYFLSRELSKHVGPNKRFTGVGEHSEFNAAPAAARRGSSRSSPADGTARPCIERDG
jgi:hypothetical protein